MDLEWSYSGGIVDLDWRDFDAKNTNRSQMLKFRRQNAENEMEGWTTAAKAPAVEDTKEMKGESKDFADDADFLQARTQRCRGILDI